MKYMFQRLREKSEYHKITKLIEDPILIPDLPCKFAVAMF